MSDQETVKVTLNGLLDEALGELTPWQRWVVERNFKRQPANRRQVLQAVEMHVAKTSPAMMTIMDADDFTADTPFVTTKAGKGELLQVILENLPAILEAIIKLIGLFGMILIACTLMASSASAQDSPAVAAESVVSITQIGGPSCAQGTCSLRARPASAGLQAVAHASSNIAVRVASSINTGVGAVAATTRRRLQARPVRTFFGGFRPFKRLGVARKRC